MGCIETIGPICINILQQKTVPKENPTNYSRFSWKLILKLVDIVIWVLHPIPYFKTNLLDIMPKIE